MTSDNHDLNNGSLNQWLRVKITSWVLKTHHSLLMNMAGDVSLFDKKKNNYNYGCISI